MREKLINLHKSTLYDKYAISFAAIILFFVGAPLGAIIRKGGWISGCYCINHVLNLSFLGTFSKNAAEMDQ